MLARQRDRVTIQLLEAEQFRAQQLGIPVVTQRIPCARRKSELFDGYDMLLARTLDGRRNPGLMTGICRKRIPCLRTLSLYRLIRSQLFVCCFGKN
jgi:hypothetical protein